MKFGKVTAFTLIEVISVMVIMILIMTVVTGGYLRLKPHTALDSAELKTLASLSLARQHAITHIRPVSIVVSNSAEYGTLQISTARDPEDDPTETERLSSDRTLIDQEMRLPRRVFWMKPRQNKTDAWEMLENRYEQVITFSPDGCIQKEAPECLTLAQDIIQNAESGSPHRHSMRRTIYIDPLTGMARALSRDEREEEEDAG